VTGCKSPYKTYSSSLNAGFSQALASTYSPQSYSCYTQSCASGYTEVSTSTACSSGVQYNGSKWCCPSANVGSGKFTFTLSAGSGCSLSSYCAKSAVVTGGMYDGTGKWIQTQYVASNSSTSIEGEAGNVTLLFCVERTCSGSGYSAGCSVSNVNLYKGSLGNNQGCYNDTGTNGCKAGTSQGTGNTLGCLGVNVSAKAGETYILKANCSCGRLN
jgi:hypothetical protein